MNHTIGADTPANYLHVYSQESDPAGLTGYAVKGSSAPALPLCIILEKKTTCALLIKQASVCPRRRSNTLTSTWALCASSEDCLPS